MSKKQHGKIWWILKEIHYKITLAMLPIMLIFYLASINARFLGEHFLAVMSLVLLPLLLFVVVGSIFFMILPEELKD